MKRHTLILCFFLALFGIFSTSAQRSVQGKIIDSIRVEAIESATIRLLNAKDSTFLTGALSDANGQFMLSKIKDGKYILQIRFLGFEPHTQPIEIAGKNLILKDITLNEITNDLHAVEVVGVLAQLEVKGDTLEYNPAAFKLAENSVVEDLLRKIPGVEVDSKGVITVNGQEIQQIRVDGKKFFSGDVQMATQNLTIDMVERLQVIDQKSEMAKLTGFDDGNTVRVINIKLKENRKKGVFGNLEGGTGLDKEGGLRYNTNVVLNLMNGTKTQTSLVVNANNINSMRSSNGQGGFIGGGSGLNETQRISFNSNTQPSKFLSIGGNGSFNSTVNTNASSSERENYLDTLTYYTRSNSKSVSQSKSANIRMDLNWRIDTLTTLVLEPNIGYSTSQSNSNSQNANLQLADTISFNTSRNESSGNGLNGSLNMIISRRSASKKGRTFTIRLGGSLNNSNNDGFRYSFKHTLRKDTTIEQRTENTSANYSYNIRTSFVEPLWDNKNLIELAASLNANMRFSDRLLYNDLNRDHVFNDIDSAYSNQLENSSFSESFDLSYRHSADRFNYTVGINVQPSQTFSKSYYLNADTVSRKNIVSNFSPNALLRYSFEKQSSLQVNYRGSTSQPSVDQIEPVKSNNPSYLALGNPTLLPSMTQNLSLSYNKSFKSRLSSFSSNASVRFTTDELVLNTFYNDSLGIQYSQTVNSKNTPLSGNAGLSFNAPIIKNRLKFSTQISGNFSQRFGYSNRSRTLDPFDSDGNLRLGLLSKTNTRGLTQNLNITLNTDPVDLELRGTVRYNRTQNSLNANKSQETYDYTTIANLSLNLPERLTVTNTWSYTARVGYSGFTKNELVWNATIRKMAFKSKGTFSLRINDILQQGQNIRESIGDASRTISRTNMLTSFFMVSYAHRITRFGMRR